MGVVGKLLFEKGRVWIDRSLRRRSLSVSLVEGYSYLTAAEPNVTQIVGIHYFITSFSCGVLGCQWSWLEYRLHFEHTFVSSQRA